MNVWELIQSNRFAEASHKADLEYEQTRNIFPLRNKIYALLHLKRYDEILSLTKQLIDLTNGSTENDFTFGGIANWALGRKEDAIEIWQSAEKCQYTDAAGGVELQLLLYFASLKTGRKELRQLSLKKLKKLLKAKTAVNWPGALAPFILGEISEETLMLRISTIPILKERQSCQAYFAIAIKEMENNNIEGYKENLKTAIKYGSAAYLEQLYYLAEIELKAL